MLQKYLIDVAIPHQSEIGFEEPICDSFPPGEAFGAFLNCKINYNLKVCTNQYFLDSWASHSSRVISPALYFAMIATSLLRSL